MYARSIRPSSRTTGLVAAARWGPGLPVDDTDDAAASTAYRTTRLASHKQIAADLLPEAGDSGAVEAEQGL
jgi:hypothetical protein